MNKNLTINMGNCHHRKYIPKLIELTLNKRVDPAKILTQVKPMSDAIEAFKAFDRRESGWIKVELHPQRMQPAGDGGEEVIADEAQLNGRSRPSPRLRDASGGEDGRDPYRHFRLALRPWRGDFYPKGLVQKKELRFASRAVNSIEINGSFYALQTPERYAGWAADTPRTSSSASRRRATSPM